MRRHVRALALAVGLACMAGGEPGRAQGRPAHVDVVYAEVDGRALALDLYMPEGVSNPPLLVWVHGGAWNVGSKDGVPLAFVQNGIATASLDFRQASDARFPAQVHDVKAAIRFLRAHAGEYGYRADRIAIAGDSSGGHLATLTGTTNGHAALEGTVGNHPDESSDVQAIIDYYGASNLTTILDQSTPFGLGVREPALQRLLGGLPDAVPDLARLASPVFHVDAGDPPLLRFHGDQDPQMPINQAHELEGVYRAHGLDVAFHVLHGSVHGGPEFYAGEPLALALEFLRRTLGN